MGNGRGGGEDALFSVSKNARAAIKAFQSEVLALQREFQITGGDI